MVSVTTDRKTSSRPVSRIGTRWRDHASCRSTGTHLFFPEQESAAFEGVEAALALCRQCPVKNACLQFALETKQEHGIWGGTTEAERRRLRRVWPAGRRRKAG